MKENSITCLDVLTRISVCILRKRQISVVTAKAAQNQKWLWQWGWQETFLLSQHPLEWGSWSITSLSWTSEDKHNFWQGGLENASPAPAFLPPHLKLPPENKEELKYRWRTTLLVCQKASSNHFCGHLCTSLWACWPRQTHTDPLSILARHLLYRSPTMQFRSHEWRSLIFSNC